MSRPFQLELQMIGDEILGITSKEREAINANRDLMCTFAEKEIKKHAGPVPDAMVVFERMHTEQRIQLARVVVEEALIFLGLRKRKKVVEEDDLEQQIIRPEFHHKHHQ